MTTKWSRGIILLCHSYRIFQIENKNQYTTVSPQEYYWLKFCVGFEKRDYDHSTQKKLHIQLGFLWCVSNSSCFCAYAHFTLCLCIIFYSNCDRWNLQVLKIQSAFVEEKVTAVMWLQRAVLSEYAWYQTKIRKGFLTAKCINEWNKA